MTIFVPENYVLEQKVVAHVVYNVDAMVMHTNIEREIKNIFIMYILLLLSFLQWWSEQEYEGWMSEWVKDIDVWKMLFMD